MHDNEKREQFIRLRVRGKSICQISKALGISKTTVFKWNGDYADDIAKARQSMVDFTLSELGLGKLDRLKIAGDLLILLKDRLLNEHNAAGTTDKNTLESIIKLYKLIENEDSPLVSSAKEKQRDKNEFVPIDLSDPSAPDWLRQDANGNPIPASQ
ncbi:MAG: helix-turn-helix domain-containing protein [Bacteroidota bacterium]